jgi:para-aminobenzoate synthetase/4-amino-4-deoxychorismate lyase
LFVKLGSSWYTPPLASGVLAGVLRTRLLARCPGISEKSISLQELLSAQSLKVGSALRGLQRAAILKTPDGSPVWT